LTKRQCLTCGYYQTGPTNGMGWCVHPKRKQTLDIKLYVRGGELPCRNDWDHDLWTDKATFSGETDLILNNAIGPLAPVSLDDIVFLTANQRPASSDPGQVSATGSAVDRVIREESPAHLPSSSPVGSMRGSVRRAHQHVLAEKRVERFADGAGPAFDGGFSAPTEQKTPKIEPKARVYEADRSGHVEAEYTATRPTFNVIPPVQPGEMRRSNPKVAIYPGEEARFSSIPRRVDGVLLPTPLKAAEVEAVTQSSSTDTADDVAISTRSTRLRPTPTSDEPRAVAFEASADLATEQIQNSPALYLPAANDVASDVEASMEFVDEVIELSSDDVPEPRRPRTRGGLFRARRKPIVEPLDDNDELWDEVPVIQAMERAVDNRQPAYAAIIEREPDLLDPALVAAADGYLTFAEPLQTALWADVPRMCRTCREFRPAESGDRGWCTNKWAFNHRRMVDADERPCDSSVGCWWLPNDDIWLALSDISAHGQPTPLLDAWLEQRLVRDFGREPAPIRRRQRG